MSSAETRLYLASVLAISVAAGQTVFCRSAMGNEFNIEPRIVPEVKSKYRRIGTPIPHPDSVGLLNKLRQYEPHSMRGQPPLVWHRAEGVCVYDNYGNQWLDWSSGVLVTNSGHAAPEIRAAILNQVNRPLL